MTEEFNDNEEEVKPKKDKEGYKQIVDSVFAPVDYLHRCEMSNMPVGNKAYLMAIAMTRQRVKAAISNGQDYDVEELLFDSYARVRRAGNGWLGEKAVEMKALEGDKESQVIHEMTGD